MIVKMKFLSITGPKNDIDRAVNDYLSKYEIHLENALSQLQSVEDLRPYIEINPYKHWLQKANAYTGLLQDEAYQPRNTLSLEDSISCIQELDNQLEEIDNRKTTIHEEMDKLQKSLLLIEPFLELDYNVHKIMEFQFVKCRFGKIAHEYFDKLHKYVYDNFDAVFYKCHEDPQYVWGAYFVPDQQATKLDAVYSSMHFERIMLPDDYDGTPSEAVAELKEQMSLCQAKLDGCDEEIRRILNQSKDHIFAARRQLNSLSSNFDVRKLAACTKDDDKQIFYILCGWMSEKDIKSFQKDIASDPDLYCIIEDDQNNILNPPPTKLKNPRLFKPFEMYVRMYGLPAYNEVDPTILVALTYSFIFGAMFGDLGQGLVLLVGGALLYHFKRIPLAAIISCAGFFSAIFGLLFGSVFGFEDIIPALWLRPVSSMVNVPFIGRLNTVFVISIGLGMFIILLTMVLHIINGLKARDLETTWFDTNGVAGLVFYGSLVLIIALFMTGHSLPAGILLIIMFVIPLLLIACKEPITALITKNTNHMPESKGMFIVQAFFELFEVLLSYFSNTLSFVRIGAFAVSHAAMMEVVLMLAGAEHGGAPNWIVIVLGNLFVCGMEGLIVGIQVLRLEYYEMFSRFYKGNGREFTPFTKEKTH